MPPCALEVDRRTAGLYTNIDRRLFILYTHKTVQLKVFFFLLEESMALYKRCAVYSIDSTPCQMSSEI